MISSVSTWLGHSTQLFNQTLTWVLLWKYFVGALIVYGQLTLKGDRLHNLITFITLVNFITLTTQFKDLKSRTGSSIRKKKFCLKTTGSALTQEFSIYQPALQSSDFLAPTIMGEPLFLQKQNQNFYFGHITLMMALKANSLK